MDPNHSSRPNRHSQAISGVLSAKGFAVGDFKLDEDDPHALSEMFGVIGGLLRVKCRSTGEERVYSTGTSSVWLGAFLMDLGRGAFSDAARERASA